MAVCDAASIRCRMGRPLGKRVGHALVGFLDVGVSAVSPQACYAETHSRVSGLAATRRAARTPPSLVRRSAKTVTCPTSLLSATSCGYTAANGRYSVTVRAAPTAGSTISSDPAGFGVTGYIPCKSR